MKQSPPEPLTIKELKTLVKLLTKFRTWMDGEQPLAGSIIREVQRWAEYEIDDAQENV